MYGKGSAPCLAITVLSLAVVASPARAFAQPCDQGETVGNPSNWNCNACPAGGDPEASSTCTVTQGIKHSVVCTDPG
jgi:hypothetical protein